MSSIDSETISEVVQQLIGPICPVGETRTDEERFARLIVAGDVVSELMSEIHRVSKKSDSHEYSVSAAGKMAKSILDGLSEWCEETAVVADADPTNVTGESCDLCGSVEPNKECWLCSDLTFRSLNKEQS